VAQGKTTGPAKALVAVDWGATRPDFKDRMTPSFGTACLGFPFARLRLACRGHQLGFAKFYRRHAAPRLP
jgi:hypothetical protein